MIDPYYKNAYSIQYNFGIEQQVKNNTVLQANYVGAHSLRTDSGSYRNTALYPAPGPIADRQPFSYITPTYYDKSVANSNYNAFQFQARTIVGKKLTLLGSYTWSKTITLGCDGFFGSEGCSVQNPYNLKADRSVAGYDLPQNFSFSWVYQLPFGRGQHFDVENSLLNEVVGGWSFQGIYTAHSGIVFNNNAGNDDLENTGNVVERADRLCKNPYNRGRNVQYLNQACFANPAAYTFGSEPRNDLRTPHVTNTDLTLEKVFPLGKEGRSVIFRTDFFNAWNQAAFGPFQGVFATRQHCNGCQLRPLYRHCPNGTRDPIRAQDNVLAEQPSTGERTTDNRPLFSFCIPLFCTSPRARYAKVATAFKFVIPAGA